MWSSGGKHVLTVASGIQRDSGWRQQAAVRKKGLRQLIDLCHSDLLTHALHHRNLLSTHHFIYLTLKSRQLSLEWNSGYPGAKRDFFFVSQSPGAIEEYEILLLDVTGHRMHKLN
jgi:hypothetical protein